MGITTILRTMYRSRQALAKLRELSVEEVASRLGEDGVHLYDTRSHYRFRRGAIPGARHLPSAKYAANQLPLDRDATLVFYCTDGNCDACQAGARRAEELGYTEVYVMPAGFEGWRSAGLPVTEAPPSPSQE